MRHLGRVVLCCATLLGVLAAPAGAVIPQGNLLKNPGAEDGPAATNETEEFFPLGWAQTPNPPTPVRYGAPAFPTTADAAALGGGRNFFAGGPNRASSTLSQNPDFSAAAAEIDAGRVQATISGCLGGYADQEDYVEISVNFVGTREQTTARERIRGPSAAERGNATKLLPRGSTRGVPGDTRYAEFYVHFHRVTGGPYNDGYADNLSLSLAPAGSPPPPPNCSAPGPGAGAGSGSQGGVTGGGGTAGGGSATALGGTNTAVPLQRAARTLRLARGRLSLPLRCAARDGQSCAGRLSLSARLPGARRAVALGATGFAIPAAQTRTVKVRLRRSAARRLAALSSRRLRRLRVTASAEVSGARTTFSLVVRRGR